MALTLIDLDTIKQEIPQWEDYISDYTTDTLDTDDILTAAGERAEAELGRYVSGLTDADDLTASLKVSLLRIIHHELFKIKHGDTPFEFTPVAVVDYRSEIKRLKNHTVGANKYRFQTHDRMFAPDEEES